MSELKMSMGKYKGYTLDKIPANYKRWWVLAIPTETDELRKIREMFIVSVKMKIRKNPMLSEEARKAELIKFNNDIKIPIVRLKAAYDYSEAE